MMKLKFKRQAHAVERQCKVDRFKGQSTGLVLNAVNLGRPNTKLAGGQILLKGLLHGYFAIMMDKKCTAVFAVALLA